MRKKTEPIDQILSRIEELDERLSRSLEKKDTTTRWSNIIIPVLSLFVALFGIGSGAYTQIRTTQYQVTFNAKQQGYADLMGEIEAAFLSSVDQNKEDLLNHTGQLPSRFYAIDPFFTTQGARNNLWESMQEIIALCNDTYDAIEQGADSATTNTLISKYIQERNAFSQSLRNELFTGISH